MVADTDKWEFFLLLWDLSYEKMEKRKERMVKQKIVKMTIVKKFCCARKAPWLFYTEKRPRLTHRLYRARDSFLIVMGTENLRRQRIGSELLFQAIGPHGDLWYQAWCSQDLAESFNLKEKRTHLAVLHSREMLDGTGKANSDVQFRRNNFPCLTNLHVVGNITSVNDSSCSTNCWKKMDA